MGEGILRIFLEIKNVVAELKKKYIYKGLNRMVTFQMIKI